MSELENNLRIVYEWLNKYTFGTVRVTRITLQRISDANASQAAAGMAYYAFFSLFPLLLFLIVGSSFWIENEIAHEGVMQFIRNMFPTAQQLIEANIKQVLQLRGAVGLISVLGFLWSSSSFFSILTRNINQAQPEYARRNFFEDRALALAMIGILALLLALSIISSTLTNILPTIDLFYINGTPLHKTDFWRYFVNAIPFLTTLLLLIALYRYVPKKKMGWNGVLIAGPIAAIAWQAITKAFSWLLQQGLVRYELVYGSLGTVVALMFWIYLISYITLFGAHLSAVIDEKSGKRINFS